MGCKRARIGEYVIFRPTEHVDTGFETEGYWQKLTRLIHDAW